MALLFGDGDDAVRAFAIGGFGERVLAHAHEGHTAGATGVIDQCFVCVGGEAFGAIVKCFDLVA